MWCFARRPGGILIAPSPPDPPPVVADFLAPNSSAIQISDFWGTAEQTADTIKFTRPIIEANNFRHQAPGARISFVTNSTSIKPRLYWNGLAPRADTWRPIITILVNGTEHATYTTSASPSSVLLEEPTIALPDGTKTVTLVMPYGGALEVRGFTLSTDAVASPPEARPTKRIAVDGDSISHGFFVTKPNLSWAYKLAEAENAQLLNLANGSMRAVADNATVGLTGSGADIVTYMIGYNNFAAQTDVSFFQSAVEGYITNARTALPSAHIYVISPIYSPNTNTIPLSSYRSAVESAETAVGDANTTFVDGLTLMTNSADRLTDGVHPNDLGSSEIASNLAGIIA